MAEILVPISLDDDEYQRLRKAFARRRNVIIEIPENLTTEQVRYLFEFFLARLPDSFAACVLSELAEIENAPYDLLEQLFDIGDSGCRVAICLRTNLSEALTARCETSVDPNVVEHWGKRRS